MRDKIILEREITEMNLRVLSATSNMVETVIWFISGVYSIRTTNLVDLQLKTFIYFYNFNNPIKVCFSNKNYPVAI